METFAVVVTSYFKKRIQYYYSFVRSQGSSLKGGDHLGDFEPPVDHTYSRIAVMRAILSLGTKSQVALPLLVML